MESQCDTNLTDSFLIWSSNYCNILKRITSSDIHQLYHTLEFDNGQYLGPVISCLNFRKWLNNKKMRTGGKIPSNNEFMRKFYFNEFKDFNIELVVGCHFLNISYQFFSTSSNHHTSYKLPNKNQVCLEKKNITQPRKPCVT